MICLSRQLSEVNIFWHENLRQLNRVFSGIVNDMRELEVPLQKNTKVDAETEQPPV